MIVNREIKPGESFWYVDLNVFDVLEGEYDPYRNAQNNLMRASHFYPKDRNAPYSLPKHICYRRREDAVSRLKVELIKVMIKLTTKMDELTKDSKKAHEAYRKHFSDPCLPFDLFKQKKL